MVRSVYANEQAITNAGQINVKEIQNFLSDENGQDLIEYTLLMAFVAMASAALFISAGGSISGIWTVSNSQLVAANTAAS
jgi:Flp pilus assembly pilin Flp